MSKVTFEVEGIKITVEREDQPMFGRRGGYREEDHFYRRGQFESNMHRPYYRRGEENDGVRRPYFNPYPSQEDWRYTVNQQYGKQSTGEPMFDESVLDSLRATANKAAEFSNKVFPERGTISRDYDGDIAIPIGKLSNGFDPNATMPTMANTSRKADQAVPFFNRHLQLDAMAVAAWDHGDNTARDKRPNQFIPALVGIDSVEVGIAALAENNDEHFHLIGAYDKIKHAIICFIGKYIFSGEAVDLPFTQTDRGDYALLLPVPYLSMDILLYVDMVEVNGKHYATAINFDYQADIEGEDEDTPVEQSAKDYILSVLKSYIVRRRDRQYRNIAAQQPSINPETEGQTDAKDGNSQVTGETPTTQQKDRF
jgi:hypothetical protein|nr:MAG TPA: hypothetical protein [Caudoviricetes sp.]